MKKTNLNVIPSLLAILIIFIISIPFFILGFIYSYARQGFEAGEEIGEDFGEFVTTIVEKYNALDDNPKSNDTN